jgi:fructose-1,6-bisphosphatase/inositol monophosphatase family enzyme
LINAYVGARRTEVTARESFDFKEGFDSAGYVAILDPIDGTENFCSGLKEWGGSLGIWHNGKYLGSLLMMPGLGESIITGDKLPKLHARITGFSSSFSDEITTGIRDAGEYRVTGCAVYNLFNVIRGWFCHFVGIPTRPEGARYLHGLRARCHERSHERGRDRARQTARPSRTHLDS